VEGNISKVLFSGGKSKNRKNRQTDLRDPREKKGGGQKLLDKKVTSPQKFNE